jgi:chaperonin cofactor prefoldin
MERITGVLDRGKEGIAELFNELFQRCQTFEKSYATLSEKIATLEARINAMETQLQKAEATK